ncbi:DNA polymerase III [Streptomyces sp. NPDC093591]|uniref:DNA polymerase III n=1 Tax=Streptomyces sp. NPDC093591 TaxID=3366044 RepID=UPI003821798A
MPHESAPLNVIDVEANCWDGQPPPGSVNEIIEIGLTVVDVAARRRVSRHRVLVRPAWSTVSDFRGWDEYDRRQFARQSRADGVAYPFGCPTERTHTDAKVVFAAAYGLRGKPGMDHALRIAGLPLEGRHRRGEDDVWNIAALVLDLVGRRAWPVVAAIVKGAGLERCHILRGR